ncbi:hypothetical protein DAPPUDRAFT_237667 [Daphnia pulex]|uniref:Uncharacterized protein n=1 Tax=Daphnia pulex TaxID=6669 RepID=E9G5J0_DAPPU|nr:hypothetical protein DAPPUDRAFT_237667 [Daphnia pulex]|eukprot:EFX85624.1 hypothetical protein DAPPUDRAFT_237667 [Daphnia pulex]
MKLLAIVIIACSVSICQAYPHDHDDQHDQDDYDFIDLIASIAAAIILDDVSDEIENLSPSELLDNVTGLIDMASLKANTLLSIDSLTAEQHVLGLASLESCVESNFTLPDPPPFVAAANATVDQLFHNLGKYDIRNNPMRIMGCFSDSISNKLVTAPESDKSLDENSPRDGNGDEIVSGVSKAKPIDFALEGGSTRKKANESMGIILIVLGSCGLPSVLFFAAMKAHPHPEKRSASLEGSFMSAVPISLTDDMPPEIESPDFPQLMVDEMTSQLDMAGYGKYYETTSLSSEQQALATADFNSCVTANLITPSLPVFVRWTLSSNEVIGNLVTANHGCSDTSVSNSTLTWIMQNLQARIAKEILQ